MTCPSIEPICHVVNKCSNTKTCVAIETENISWLFKNYFADNYGSFDALNSTCMVIQIFILPDLIQLQFISVETNR